MDSDFLETRTRSTVWSVAGVAITGFFVLLFLYNLFS